MYALVATQSKVIESFTIANAGRSVPLAPSLSTSSANSATQSVKLASTPVVPRAPAVILILYTHTSMGRTAPPPAIMENLEML
jgi:hypothetical protein